MKTEVETLIPQLMHIDWDSNPLSWLSVHTLIHHTVLGAGFCSQGMFVLVLLQQVVKDVH